MILKAAERESLEPYRRLGIGRSEMATLNIYFDVHRTDPSCKMDARSALAVRSRRVLYALDQHLYRIGGEAYI